jgi:hypothetical protein
MGEENQEYDFHKRHPQNLLDSTGGHNSSALCKTKETHDSNRKHGENTRANKSPYFESGMRQKRKGTKNIEKNCTRKKNSWVY